MTTNLQFASILAVATLSAGIAWIPVAPTAAANGPAVQTQHDHADTTPAPATDQQTMKMREDMMARMKKGDDRVQALVTAMNKATGDAKIAAMATLLTALADERAGMRDGMMQMQEAMAACPMMQHAPAKD